MNLNKLLGRSSTPKAQTPGGSAQASGAATPQALDAPSGLGFEQTKLALTVLSKLGEGAVSVPGLKAASEIALHLVTVAEVCPLTPAPKFCLTTAARAECETKQRSVRGFGS